jgi:hypothetical protein
MGRIEMATPVRLTKRCPRCCEPGKELPASVFAPDAARYDGLSPYCVPCKRAVQRESWQRHRDEWTPLYVERMKARRLLMKERVARYLMDHPCVDCGERDLDVLEFDHRAGEGKDAEVSRLVNDGAAWDRIEREISKCEVRCANDHRRRHARERKLRGVA